MTRKRELYSSAIRSRLMIREALLELMKEKSFDSISISEIMKKADLVRRTFYAHYKTKEDVISMYIDELVCESFEDILKGVEECGGTMALIYFRLWNDHQEFINLLKESKQLILLNTFHIKTEFIRDEYNAFKNLGFSEGAEKYAARFYAGVMWTILAQWIESGMEETPEQLSVLLDELLSVTQRRVG